MNINLNLNKKSRKINKIEKNSNFFFTIKLE